MNKITTPVCRIDYVKPEIVDLGAVTPLAGDTCSSGSGDSLCSGGSDNTTSNCQNGTNAGANCNTGSAVGTPANT